MKVSLGPTAHWYLHWDLLEKARKNLVPPYKDLPLANTVHDFIPINNWGKQYK